MRVRIIIFLLKRGKYKLAHRLAAHSPSLSLIAETIHGILMAQKNEEDPTT